MCTLDVFVGGVVVVLGHMVVMGFQLVGSWVSGLLAYESMGAGSYVAFTRSDVVLMGSVHVAFAGVGLRRRVLSGPEGIMRGLVERLSAVVHCALPMGSGLVLVGSGLNPMFMSSGIVAVHLHRVSFRKCNMAVCCIIMGVLCLTMRSCCKCMLVSRILISSGVFVLFCLVNGVDVV